MIIVAEGPTAVGKSHYVATFPSAQIVGEKPGHVRPPDVADIDGVSRFWTRRSEERWARALDRENDQGRAVCDTDPLKLHLSWTLARAGLSATADEFTRQLELTRSAITRKTLGVADLIACVTLPEDVLREQRKRDISRRRRNFEVHVRLAEPLREWYATLNSVDPGRVAWEWPDVSHWVGRRERYDLDLFDTWMAKLPPL
ncbi:hypothetical protein OYE22_31170 [Streptomyces sp. 71268]|uniref:hypothetical protein n=1 Tax=Streptomyces sp. 71268 TaxID=3002640 RepID=UPI0023F918AA|nr:hypothetical protein [Streptomyces sp. 71268]WEV29150.1 hypothetical protein OYE22_31170 [Streptomyces sp. 71268]